MFFFGVLPLHRKLLNLRQFTAAKKQFGLDLVGPDTLCFREPSLGSFLLFELQKLSDIFDPVHYTLHAAIVIQDRRVHRAPMAFLKSAAALSRPAYIVLL